MTGAFSMRCSLAICLGISWIGFAIAQGTGGARETASAREEEYYAITAFETPPGAVLEIGAMQWMSDGTLAVATRRGEIWMVRDPLAPQVKASQFVRFAHGLHEPLGLAEKDGWLYVTQRSDVSRLRDRDADGVADEFEVVADGWEINGDYHEYAFGSKFDRDGNLWVALCLTGSFGSDVPFRGWALRVTQNGETIPTTYGLRSPGGVGFNAKGDVFYTDNQGPWNGTCGLKQLVPGKFAGHPGGNKWMQGAKPFQGVTPVQPLDNSRMAVEAAKHQDLVPTAVLFPYNKMGQSASGIVCDRSGGKFGPFGEQLFVGDQTHSTLMRVDLEVVDGVYQGACFPFRAGFGSGVVGMEMGPNGSVFVGGTNRGWGSRGPKDFALERLDWTGKTPFEIQSMRLTPTGFKLAFTEPVDPGAAGELSQYTMETYTYIYREQYGSPEVDHTKPTLSAVRVSANGREVELDVEGLQIGHVHELRVGAMRSAAGNPLLHREAYYTLNRRK
jgi:glucose/arabinose dehydrogenase